MEHENQKLDATYAERRNAYDQLAEAESKLEKLVQDAKDGKISAAWLDYESQAATLEADRARKRVGQAERKTGSGKQPSALSRLMGRLGLRR